ncbi:MAG: HAD family hydrolase [Rhodospirillales bacterium]
MDLSNVRLVAFDFDGTLVDSNSIKRDAFFQVAADFPDGRNAMEKVLTDQASADRFTTFQKFCQMIGQPEKSTSCAQSYGALCEAHILEASEPAGLRAFLGLLRERAIPRAICSATPENHLVRLAKIRFNGCFEVVRGRPDTKPDILRGLAERYGLGCQELLMVGDGPDDYAAANRVGCLFVGMTAFGYRLSDKAHCVDTYDQLAVLMRPA